MKKRENAFVTLRMYQGNILKWFIPCKNVKVAADLAWELAADPHLPAEKLDSMRERIESANNAIGNTVELFEAGDYSYQIHLEYLCTQA